MSEKSIELAEFAANSLRFVDEVEHDGQPLVITRDGVPLAVLSPPLEARASIIGALAGTVLHFDESTAPLDVQWPASNAS